MRRRLGWTICHCCFPVSKLRLRVGCAVLCAVRSECLSDRRNFYPCMLIILVLSAAAAAEGQRFPCGNKKQNCDGCYNDGSEGACCFPEPPLPMSGNQPSRVSSCNIGTGLDPIVGTCFCQASSYGSQAKCCVPSPPSDESPPQPSPP